MILLQISNRSCLKQRKVLENIQTKEALLVDARSTDRFLAETEEPRAGLRSGHIPVQ
jgi:thiosulfate/3-mercaptopyruvate sulfurtransferase